MKKKLMLATLVAVLAPVLWLGFGRQDDGPDYSFGFGKQIAGGWLVTVNVGYDVDLLMTLAADGGFVASGQLRTAGPDGTGAWEHTRYNTTSHGSWKQTGRNKIELTLLLQVQNNDGVAVMYERGKLWMTLNAAGANVNAKSGRKAVAATSPSPLRPQPVAKRR